MIRVQNRPISLGDIALTTLNSVTFTGYTRIVGEITLGTSPSPPYLILAAGTQLQKTGRTTGTTAGTIVSSCENRGLGTDPRTGLEVRLLCQHQADFASAGGDSGSPVFVPPNSSGQTYLVGIYHSGGCDPVSGICRAGFSSLSSVRAEFPQFSIKP